MWERIHARCLSNEEKRGTLGRHTPWDMACSGVNSLDASCLECGTSCLDCGVGVASAGMAEGAMAVVDAMKKVTTTIRDE